MVCRLVGLWSAMICTKKKSGFSQEGRNKNVLVKQKGDAPFNCLDRFMMDVDRRNCHVISFGQDVLNCPRHCRCDNAQDSVHRVYFRTRPFRAPEDDEIERKKSSTVSPAFQLVRDGFAETPRWNKTIALCGDTYDLSRPNR